MNRQVFNKKKSIQSEQNSANLEEQIAILPAARIHRANILARIIHSLSIYRARWGFNRLLNESRTRMNKNKILQVLNQVFRRSNNQHKFSCITKMKNLLIKASEERINKSKRIVSVISKSSKTLLCFLLRSKRRQIIRQVFQKIKIVAVENHQEKRFKKRTAIRTIISIMNRDKKKAFQKIFLSKQGIVLRSKLRTFTFLLGSHTKRSLMYGFWRMRKNCLQKRRENIQQDIKVFEAKISNMVDPELEAIREKKQKLLQFLNKVQQEKIAIQGQFQQELQEVQNKRRQLQQNVKDAEKNKIEIQSRITKIQQSIKADYSLDEIFQCFYFHFLIYLEQNQEKVYNKEEILHALTQPIIPIDVPVQIIKQENQAMQELLNQYIVMFGHRKLEGPIKLPYQYLVKQNKVMYKMLLTLLAETEGDKNDLRGIRDCLFQLSSKVNEFWGKR